MSKKNEEIDWNAYAAEYDIGTIVMSRPYKQLVKRVSNEYSKLELPSKPIVADFGVGTGNFLLPLTKITPNGNFYGIDFFDNFLNLFKEKAKSYRGQIIPIKHDVQKPYFPDNTLDAALVVHVANTLDQPLSVYQNAFRALKSGGYLITSDIGRVVEPTKWIRPIVFASIEDNGLLTTIKYLQKTRTFRKVNNIASQRQKEGLSYMHDSVQFQEDLLNLGYEIIKADIEYNGVDDFVVARKPIQK